MSGACQQRGQRRVEWQSMLPLRQFPLPPRNSRSDNLVHAAFVLSQPILRHEAWQRGVSSREPGCGGCPRPPTLSFVSYFLDNIARRYLRTRGKTNGDPCTHGHGSIDESSRPPRTERRFLSFAFFAEKPHNSLDGTTLQHQIDDMYIHPLYEVFVSPTTEKTRNKIKIKLYPGQV